MRNIFHRSPSPSYITASSPARSLPPLSPVPQTFSESLMNENVENAEFIIEKWKRNSDVDKSSGSSVYEHAVTLFPTTKNREEAKRYIKAVHDLQAAMKNFISVKYGSDIVVRAQKLMQSAMKQLEKEFYYVLKSCKGRLDPETVSSRLSKSGGGSVSEFEGDSVSDFEGEFSDEDPESVKKDWDTERGFLENDTMMDLKLIADCMISCGYTKDCVKIYKLVRKSIVDEGLYNLGVERLSFSQVQKMDWDSLETKIKTWLNASKIAVKSVFYGERLLADHVFSVSASIAESCFAEVTGEGARSVFGFPEYIAKSKRTPEQIFRTLDVYEAVSELWPEIEFVFSSGSTSTVRTQAVNSMVTLGEAVRAMLTDFETAIQKDASKTAIRGGGVHPLTRYVMNYISFLTDYSDSYVDIVADWPLTVPSPFPESYFGSPEAEGGIHSSSASVRLAWLVLVLLCKLDSRAQLYNDVALSYLFLANNLQYVVVKVRSSNLSYFLGKDWVVKHEVKVKQYVANYERIGWGKVITSLPENPTLEIPLDNVKEYFRKFNATFLEVYKKHYSIIVHDEKMRDEIKTSLTRKLLPIYREFYSKYRVELQRMYWVEHLVRFVPEDLEDYLSNMFYGTSGVGSSSIPSSPARPATMI